MTATEINRINLDAVNDMLTAQIKHRNSLPRNTSAELRIFSQVQLRINKLIHERGVRILKFTL